MAKTTNLTKETPPKERGTAKEKPKAALAQQMPLWAERVRCLPNPMARSALFGVGSRKPRRQFKNQVIASLADTSINYTGAELRQDDEDVFMQLCHLARGRAIEESFDFSAYAMLKELGWGHSSKSYQRLRDCMDRLKANALKVSLVLDGKKIVFSGSLVRKWARSEDPDNREHWKVWLEREVITLFEENIASEVEWAVRCRLKGDIAKWLLGFFVTWDERIPAEIAELRRLCGSGCASMGAYRQMLRNSLDQLKEAGFLHDWKMDTEHVWITRDPTTLINRIKPSKKLANEVETME